MYIIIFISKNNFIINKDQERTMKKFFSSLPNDLRQTLSALAVAVALLCGSLFMLSAYMDSIRESNLDAEAMATLPEESTAPTE